MCSQVVSTDIHPRPLRGCFPQDDEEGEEGEEEEDDDDGSEMELDEDYPDMNASPLVRFERFDRDDDLIIEFDNMFSSPSMDLGRGAQKRGYMVIWGGCGIPPFTSWGGGKVGEPWVVISLWVGGGKVGYTP